jgi:hypothetical protein
VRGRRAAQLSQTLLDCQDIFVDQTDRAVDNIKTTFRSVKVVPKRLSVKPHILDGLPVL